jgi:hypothetical protein
MCTVGLWFDLSPVVQLNKAAVQKSKSRPRTTPPFQITNTKNNTSKDMYGTACVTIIVEFLINEKTASGISAKGH